MTTTVSPKVLNELWVQAFNDRDWDAEAGFRHPSYAAHVQGAPVTLDSAGWAEFMGMFVAGFPDVQISIDSAVTERDTVASRWTMTGTHRGDFLGNAATGRQISITGIDFSRVVDGKIAEHWAQFDGLGLLQQIGA
ncbi:MAG: ester cyclase [Nocardiaceae bacterium]|nr:ester cyclase [Nocardiaceae bacterium]